MTDHIAERAVGPMRPANPDGSFYSWGALDRRGRGAGGVTAAPHRATELLGVAVYSLAPGATGFVRLVRLDQQAWPAAYLYGKVLLRVRRTTTGEVVLARGES
ncbi:hypothetical protein [Nonomuraea sp. B19D2]|uniref:hypothetical protein n=1 Tax=Nonomuraea sp. B19D2 TaxID=3159561 RepID=UPI0032DB4D43